MNFKCWGMLAVVTVGFFGWNWYQEKLLWDAARAYYVEPLKKNKKLFMKVVQACEEEQKKENIQAGGEWSSYVNLLRGRSGATDFPYLKYIHNYKFHIQIYKEEKSGFTTLSCDYDPDRQKVNWVDD